jgi:hypothetical protein
MNLFITLLENVNKSRTSANNVSLKQCGTIMKKVQFAVDSKDSLKESGRKKQKETMCIAERRGMESKRTEQKKYMYHKKIMSFLLSQIFNLKKQLRQ